MLPQLEACLAIVISVPLYLSVDLNNIQPSTVDKCKGTACYVVTEQELYSSLLRAHRAGRNRTLDDLNRGVLAARLNELEKENEQCNKPSP